MSSESGAVNELAAKLSSFRSLDAEQINFLRSLFLSFSNRPFDQSHVHEFVRKQYRDIPAEARGQLGQNILDLFRAEDRAAEEDRKATEAALEAGEKPNVKKAAKPTPKLTWKSFHRVCAALGLHLSEKRGVLAICKYASDAPNNAAGGNAAAARLNANEEANSPGFAALSAAIEPGMSFDDFMVFYASLSKPLSVSQEMKEVWRLMDEDLDGYVSLKTLRNCMIGMEYISPSNTKENSTYFYESNYPYQYSELEKNMTKEQLVDSLLLAHFTNKNLETDKIDLAEFTAFMYG